MRVLALDYGRARCGCAVSDPSGTLATPLEPVTDVTSRRGRARLRDLVKEVGAERVATVRVETLDGLVPKGIPYGVCVQARHAIVVQQTRRSLEKGGYPSTRAIFGTMAIPWVGEQP